MGFANFDKANLAVLAYAIVDAIGTVRAAANLEMSPGHTPGSSSYTLVVPDNIRGGKDPLFSDTDICLVTIMDTQGVIPQVINADETTKIVDIFIASTGMPAPSNFTIVVLRTLIKQP
jgi:hypothetical protein